MSATTYNMDELMSTLEWLIKEYKDTQDLDKFEVFIETPDLERIPVANIRIKTPFDEDFKNNGVILFTMDEE